MTEETPKKTLTRKQQVFIDEYLKCFNGAEAARRAGYSENNARKAASLLLADADINGQIQARMTEVHMSANEALRLTAEIARGDIGDLIDDNGLLDLRTARAKGMTKLIKKIKQKTITRIGKSDNDDDIEITEIEFEMYPSDTAQERILKIAGKFVDRQDITSNGQTINVTIKGIDD